MTVKVESYDLGLTVICDMCDDDYTSREDVGGIAFGGRAVCPGCTPRVLADAARFEETHYIRARAAPNETFRDFVYRLRGGGGHGRVTVTSVDTAEEFMQILQWGMKDAES